LPKKSRVFSKKSTILGASSKYAKKWLFWGDVSEQKRSVIAPLRRDSFFAYFQLNFKHG